MHKRMYKVCSMYELPKWFPCRRTQLNYSASSHLFVLGLFFFLFNAVKWKVLVSRPRRQLLSVCAFIFLSAVLADSLHKKRKKKKMWWGVMVVGDDRGGNWSVVIPSHLLELPPISLEAETTPHSRLLDYAVERKNQRREAKDLHDRVEAVRVLLPELDSASAVAQTWQDI